MYWACHTYGFGSVVKTRDIASESPLSTRGDPIGYNSHTTKTPFYYY